MELCFTIPNYNDTFHNYKYILYLCNISDDVAADVEYSWSSAHPTLIVRTGAPLFMVGQRFRACTYRVVPACTYDHAVSLYTERFFVSCVVLYLRAAGGPVVTAPIDLVYLSDTPLDEITYDRQRDHTIYINMVFLYRHIALCVVRVWFPHLFVYTNIITGVSIVTINNFDVLLF